MRLTKFTDLALRVAMRVAVADAADTLTTKEVAAGVAASYAHVAKVVSRLQGLGVLETRRGRGGGLLLAAHGERFSVGWLVRDLEGYGEVVGCEDAPACPLRADCRLRHLLPEAQEAFYRVLDPVTIGDLVGEPAHRRVLVQLMRSPTA